MRYIPSTSNPSALALSLAVGIEAVKFGIGPWCSVMFPRRHDKLETDHHLVAEGDIQSRTGLTIAILLQQVEFGVSRKSSSSPSEKDD